MAEKKLHPHNEAGRRLKAALVSYRVGRAGVDQTLKESPEDAGEDWAELAEELLREMDDQIASRVVPISGGSNKIQ
jgi:hypothetical protein